MAAQPIHFDDLVRRQMLYPTELRAHGAIYFTINHLQPLLGKLPFQVSVQSVQYYNFVAKPGPE
jgi:hypothetical protein